MDKNMRQERLAIERTKLANERTFLSYFRTTIVFLGSGLSVLTIHLFEEIKYLGIILVTLAPILLGVGVWRLLTTRNTIRAYLREMGLLNKQHV